MSPHKGARGVPDQQVNDYPDNAPCVCSHAAGDHSGGECWTVHADRQCQCFGFRSRRDFNDPSNCHWCGGQHHAAQCRGWDGR